jgi:hypothetical protein
MRVPVIQGLPPKTFGSEVMLGNRFCMNFVIKFIFMQINAIYKYFNNLFWALTRHAPDYFG